MHKVVLVTGGSRSGKSTFAESLLKDKEDVLYIATAIVTDSEMEDRIKKHRDRRSPNWDTLEGFKDLDKKLKDYKNEYILLDCVTIMLTNLMFECERDFDHMTMEGIDELLQYIKSQFDLLIFRTKELDRTLIMVTNEVGYGLVPEYKLSRIFRDMAGSVNQHIASLSDEVYLVACGLPVKLK